MVVAEGRPKAGTMFELVRAANITGEDIIRVLGCRREPVQLLNANATYFEQALQNATVSRGELQTMGAWAALGLSTCAERGVLSQIPHFEKILDAIEAREASLKARQSQMELSGCRFNREGDYS